MTAWITGNGRSCGFTARLVMCCKSAPVFGNCAGKYKVWPLDASDEEIEEAARNVSADMVVGKMERDMTVMWVKAEACCPLVRSS